jgi:hypothetical protein
MTDEQLNALLAERLMGWRVGDGRFLLGCRQWIPQWRFQPTTRTADALRLLEQVAPTAFSMDSDSAGAFRVRLKINGRIGVATNLSQARAITYALARASQIDVSNIRVVNAAAGTKKLRSK